MFPRLWLLPNLLSLDAPLIALLWQALFVRCFHSKPSAWSPVLLVASVWLIYAADRALDAWRASPGQALRARHEFYRRHWRGVLPCWLFAFCACGWLAWRYFPPAEFSYGVMLLAGVAVYLASVHLKPAALARAGSKEAVVAFVFGLGTTLAAWPHLSTVSDFAAVVLFSVSCWINCVSIEDWESRRPLRASAVVAAAMIALVAALLLSEHRPVLGTAETASALALIALDRLQSRLSPEALRVLADAALATPLLCLPLASLR